MSQFHPSQHGSDSDVQMWQRQMLYKQLQEFQRQQQQQQLDHGDRMQNSFGQFQAPAKQSPADQFPTMMNEMPMNEPSSYAWSNGISVGGSRLGSNSQILNNGNPHWEQHHGASPGTSSFVNGAVYSNIQNLMRPIGSVNNKVNQSFHSLPASMSKGSGNQYSQFPGFPATSHNAMARPGSDQSDMTARFASSINSFQNEHGLCEQVTSNNLQNFCENGSVLSDSSTQSQGGNLKTGSPVLVNHLQHGFHLQHFNGRMNQVECQSATHVGPASSAASLDPTEEKILYGDDNNFTGLLGEDDSSDGVPGHDNSSGNGNSSIPLSAQGGSWSALMQEALQSTSSKNGLQEEWSGMNFQNRDQAFTNKMTSPDLEQRQDATLNSMYLHSASPSAQPSPSHDGSSGTMNNLKFTSFQRATKSVYDQQEKFSYGSTSTAINNHTTTGANDGFFQPSLKQSHSGDCGSPEHADLSIGVWAQQKPGLLKRNLNSGGEHLMPQHAQGLGVLQQNRYDHNFNGEFSNNQNNWNGRNSNCVNTYSINNFQQSKPDVSTVQVPNDCYSSKNTVLTSSSTRMFSPGQHQMMLGQSGENFGSNNTPGQRPLPETSDSQVNNAEHGLADFSQMYINATSAEGHNSNNGQHLGNSFSARGNSFSGMDAHSLGQSDQKTMCPSAQLNHLSATSGISTGHFPTNSSCNTKFLSESIQLPNNQENLLGGSCQLAGHVGSTNEKIAMVEEQLTQHATANKYSNEPPFRGYDGTLLQNPNKIVQTSQHMLQQFLQKADNSNSVVSSNMPIRSDITTNQLNQPPLQGFGLKLAPPMQQQPTSGNLWTSHTSVDIKPTDNSVPGEDQRQLPSTPGSTTSSGYPSRSSPFYSSDADNTGLSSGCLPQTKSLGWQYPVADPKSAPVNSLPQQSLQGTAATMFKNAWTNISAQRLRGIQHNKITPNIPKSMMFPGIIGDSTLWGCLKDDYQRMRGENLSDAATFTTNSGRQEIKRVVENDGRPASSDIPNVDQMGDMLSGKKNALQRPLMQHGITNSSQGENMAANIPNMGSSFNKVSTYGGISLHGSLAPSNSQQINYSVLHQMQAMKPVDSDPENTSGKRLKTTDVSCDASQVEWPGAERTPRGENNPVRLCTDKTKVPRISNLLPSDQMLRFAPRNSEDVTSTMPSQVQLRELTSTSNDMATAQTDLQNQCSSLGTSSTENLIESGDKLRINPQISPWFQHGSYRNGQNLAMYSVRKTASPCKHPKVPWSMDNSSVSGHGLECSTSVRPEMPSGLKVSSAVRRPKKRKLKAPVLVSWNQIIEGHQKLVDMSTLGMDWPEATNKLMEKVEDESDIQEDALVLYLPRKRLIMTSRLIQQLLPSIPAAILRAQAISMYPSATYTIAKLTIGDACSMPSNSSLDTGTLISSADKSYVQIENDKMRDRFTKAVEFFIPRFNKMENDFVSLNKRSSMLDIQLECQDLERISIVNRLGRFHARNHHAAGVEASSTDLAPRRIYRDRHVMTFAVPGNLPDGVPCSASSVVTGTKLMESV
uniref:Uncharacterized protein n=1 Tax=Oryza punctata TaxID=4537 RepID=A0A0E0M6G3_ORYPU